jgi:type II secretory pathway component PulJ
MGAPQRMERDVRQAGSRHYRAKGIGEPIRPIWRAIEAAEHQRVGWRLAKSQRQPLLLLGLPMIS